MAKQTSSNPVGRIIDAARRIVDVVTPGDTGSGDKRGPIPATAPPGLRKAGESAKRVATATTRSAVDAATKTVETARDAAGATVETARKAAGRAADSAKKGARSTREEASRGAHRTTKTARKQAQRTRDQAAEATQDVKDQVAKATSDRPGAGVAYEEWTKAQLYERAQELDISGRSQMNKDELINALRDRG